VQQTVWQRRLAQAVRESGIGMVALHNAFIVHSDFKPQNVLVKEKLKQDKPAEAKVSIFRQA
jgi:tRNA A-37 threonylcarbamoyl transferase component Bud32